MEKEVFIHVGMPKAGSPEIQKQIMALHESDNEKLDNELQLGLKKYGYY